MTTPQNHMDVEAPRLCTKTGIHTCRGGSIHVNEKDKAILQTYFTTQATQYEEEKAKIVETIRHLDNYAQHDISCITQFEEDEECDCGLVIKKRAIDISDKIK